MRRIVESKADIVVILEYDVHLGPLFCCAEMENVRFPDAMAAHGYTGLLFDGVLQHKEGIGIFWRSDVFALSEPTELGDVIPEDTYVSGPVRNMALVVTNAQGETLPDRIRRHSALVSLKHLVTDKKLWVCGVHFSPSSRDDAEGTIRSQELQQTMDALARIPDGIVWAGDFNINLRSQKEECILQRVSSYGVVDGKRQFRSGDVLLEDAYGDINAGNTVATSYTLTRNQMIDYIFYSPKHLEFVSRSDLHCPEIPMPNTDEPSDHIPLAVELQWRI